MIPGDPKSAVEDFDDITCEYWRGTELRTRQLAKQVISRSGGHAVIAFQAQFWAKGKWQNPHCILTRWVKRRGKWRLMGKFHLYLGQATPALASVAGWEASCTALSRLGIDLGGALQGASDGLHSG